MEYSQITKQMIDFQKKSFDSWYNTVTLAQDQAVSTMDMLLDQAVWIPQDGRNAIQSWMNIYQEERNRFKSYVEMGFTFLEKSMTDFRRTAERVQEAARP